jgi:hypothetical protein
MREVRLLFGADHAFISNPCFQEDQFMRLRVEASWRPALVAGLLLLGTGAAPAAPSLADEPIAPIAVLSGDTTVFWTPQPGLPKYDRLVLKVALPNGAYEEYAFPQKEIPAFTPLGDGVYIYEMYLVPVGVAKRPDPPGAAPPAAGQRGPKRGLVQAGSFAVVNGLWVDPATIDEKRKVQAQRGGKP